MSEIDPVLLRRLHKEGIPQTEVLQRLRSLAHSHGLETMRGGYPAWAELCACVDARQTDCELCDGTRWVKGTEPYCLDCEHSGCPFCPGWCDVLESKDDPGLMCCDTECRYPVDKPPSAYWDAPPWVPPEPEPEETLEERVARHEAEALERRKFRDAEVALYVALQNKLARARLQTRGPHGDVLVLMQLFFKLPVELQNQCIEALGADDANRMLDIFEGKPPSTDGGST